MRQNREAYNARARSKYKENKEHYRARNRARYAEKRETKRAYMNAWYAANAARYREKRREYKKTPAGKASMAAYNHRRRVNRQGRRVTTAQIKAILAAPACHICGKRFTKLRPSVLDHVIPLSKGGIHAISNLAAAHATCNQRKHARLENPLTGQGILL